MLNDQTARGAGWLNNPPQLHFMHFKMFSCIGLANPAPTSDFGLGIQLASPQVARFFPWNTGVYPGLFKNRRIVQQSCFTPYPHCLPPLRRQGAVAKQKAPYPEFLRIFARRISMANAMPMTAACWRSSRPGSMRTR